MEEPVELGGPLVSIGVAEVGYEVLGGLLWVLLDGQRLADVADVIQGLQLGDAARQHQREQRDEQVGVLAQDAERLAAQLLESAAKKIQEAKCIILFIYLFIFILLFIYLFIYLSYFYWYLDETMKKSLFTYLTSVDICMKP